MLPVGAAAAAAAAALTDADFTGAGAVAGASAGNFAVALIEKVAGGRRTHASDMDLRIKC